MATSKTTRGRRGRWRRRGLCQASSVRAGLGNGHRMPAARALAQISAPAANPASAAPSASGTASAGGAPAALRTSEPMIAFGHRKVLCEFSSEENRVRLT